MFHMIGDIENAYIFTGFNLNSVLVVISSDKLIYNTCVRDIGKNNKSVQSRASRRGNTCANIGITGTLLCRCIC